MHEKERRYLQHLRLTQAPRSRACAEPGVKKKKKRKKRTNGKGTEASKHTYYRQRTIATLRWPRFELFLTIDGGTGTTYHLPRQYRRGERKAGRRRKR